jgi:hypothetical protein
MKTGHRGARRLTVMRRASGLVLAVALVAGACAGSPGPTGSPIPPLASASSSPSPEATLATTASPIAGPTLIPYPGPSIPPETLTIEIAAEPNLKFDRTEMTAPAGTPFVIAFDNRDLCDANCQKVYSYPLSGLPHNVAIKLGSDLLFNPLPAIVAPAKVSYFISGGLAAGTYRFLCIVHPVQMQGTLTIT